MVTGPLSAPPPPSVGLQAPSKATMEQVHNFDRGGPAATPVYAKKAIAPPPDLNAMVKKTTMVMGSSSFGGSTAMQADAEKAIEATLEATKVVVAAKEAAAVVTAKEAVASAVAKVALEPTPDLKAMAEKITMTTELGGAGTGEPRAAQAHATLDVKVTAKRSATTMGLGGSSPPRKCFRGA
jgi:hypothetical protein